MDSPINIKEKIAYENMSFFWSNAISFQEKRILDVGFGLGFNSKMMSELGADVYGVEPDKEAYDYAISNNMINKDKAFNCTLQELPNELVGTFDIVIVFLYNISYSERDEIAKMLAKAVKKDGFVIIGLHDNIYINGDQFMPPISQTISPYFENVKVSKINYAIGNKCFIVATQPVQNLEHHDSMPRISNKKYCYVI